MELSESIIKLQEIIEKIVAEMPYKDIERIKRKYNKESKD